MKKVINLPILILMIAILFILSTNVEATTGKINTETARIRKEPNTESKILEQLDENNEVEILEQLEGWYKINATVNGQKITGYISKELVDVQEDTQLETPKVEETTTEPSSNEQQAENNEQEKIITIEQNGEYTLSQELSIKIVPLINSIEKAKISSGNVKVVEIINNWCKVENAEETGWIRINTLKKAVTVQETPTEAQPVETPEEPEKPVEPENKPVEETKPEEEKVIKTAYVSSDGLRVRSEPNTTSEILDSLSKNTKISILKELDGWYKVKVGDVVGYVSAKYVSDTKVTEATSRDGTTLKDNENTTQQTEEQPKEQVAQPSETTGTTGAAVVEYAKKLVGSKYKAGGASPETGFDCSGFTTYVYKQFGVTLNRSAKDQIKNGVAVEKSNLQLGDLVIFRDRANKTVGHVGIYIGDGNFVHAANEGSGVKITSLSLSYYSARYVGARRVI